MDQRQEIRDQLRSKILEKRLSRSNKHTQEQVLEKTMKKMGIDKERFQKDLENVTKAGGFHIDVKK